MWKVDGCADGHPAGGHCVVGGWGKRFAAAEASSASAVGSNPGVAYQS
jgi:hypothetical protein